MVTTRSSHSAGSAAMARNYGGFDWSGGRDPEDIRVEALRAELVAFSVAKIPTLPNRRTSLLAPVVPSGTNPQVPATDDRAAARARMAYHV